MRYTSISRVRSLAVTIPANWPSLKTRARLPRPGPDAQRCGEWLVRLGNGHPGHGYRDLTHQGTGALTWRYGAQLSQRDQPDDRSVAVLDRIRRVAVTEQVALSADAHPEIPPPARSGCPHPYWNLQKCYGPTC
jgi:hypothetical protein